MAFTNREKEEWHENRRAGRDLEGQHLIAECAHCGAPMGTEFAQSEFPLCDACDD